VINESYFLVDDLSKNFHIPWQKIAKLAPMLVETLENTPPAELYAGIKGKVAGIGVGRRGSVLVRRTHRGIRIELWSHNAPYAMRSFGWVPLEFVDRVQAVLDSIPE
jgi:hypothetical protein